MTSILPSLIAPISPLLSPPAPPPSSSSNSSPTAPAPSTSQTNQPDQTTDPPLSSAPPPQSPPPAVPSAPPPSPPLSPPPVSAPPPSPPASPPPTPPSSPPPSPPSLPPPSPPSAPPPGPPPSPPVSTTPPTSGSSPPPQTSPAPPAATPPSPEVVTPPSPSPPSPPADVPSQPSSSSPPPPVTDPPKASSTPPTVTPPPSDSHSAPPPAKSESGLATPPPSSPVSSSPPAVSRPAPPGVSSTTGSPTISELPAIPTEKPTAGSTHGDQSPDTASSGSGGMKTGSAVAIGVVVGFVVLSLLAMTILFVKKRKRRNARSDGYGMPSPFASSQNSDTVFIKSPTPAPHYRSGSGNDFMYPSSQSGGLNNSRSWFTYEELSYATNGFSAENLLGEGGFGCVYKGVLTDAREVAVKQLKIGGGQGEREFKAEVEIISRVHHRHLVSLVGYCISEHQRLLVYDFVQNDTLHHHLHDSGTQVMNWATRVKVAAGAARGIAYLHEDCHPRIIHRDIKSSNILLDSKFEAQVSDFGLAKLALDSNTHVTTRVMGTFGYMAPEYATSGKLTEKSDVYSFGVVLLELITGRRPVDGSQPLGDESLVEWARPLLNEALERQDFDELADPKLEKNYIASEMFRMIEAAAACIRHSATKRPRMGQVVRALDSLDEFSDLTNGMKPGQSEVFDSAQQSAQIRMFQRMAFGSQDYSSSVFNHTQSSWNSREGGDRSAYMP